MDGCLLDDTGVYNLKIGRFEFFMIIQAKGVSQINFSNE